MLVPAACSCDSFFKLLLIFTFSKGLWYDEPKHIVEHSQLVELLKFCEICGETCTGISVSRHGAYSKFEVNCQACHHTREWETSRRQSHMPIINLMLSFVILFSGSLPTKFLRALKFLNVCIPTVDTFHFYQKKYLHGVSYNNYVSYGFITVSPRGNYNIDLLLYYNRSCAAYTTDT